MMRVRQSWPTDGGKPRSAKRRALRVFGSLPGIIYLLSLFGVFSPILSPLVYPNLAPPGWHNITPHGHIALNDFAASAETPGLMVACGSVFNITVIDPTTWIPGRLHFWRSRDGGAHWELLHPPFGDGKLCNVSMIAGEPGTIIATIQPTYDRASPSYVETSWISHDAGVSWRRITTTNGYAMGAYDRHSLLYGLGGSYDSTAGTIDYTLAVSADHGSTWTQIPSRSSVLQQQGWHTNSPPVPDYREDHWWYRVLTLQDKPPMLEHSTDDGYTWTLVGPLATVPFQSVLLATTPLAPGHLCAARFSGETNLISIFSSADGGQTWQTGAMPANLANTAGETAYRLQIGANGDCYQGYFYHRARTSTNEHGYVFLHLTPQSSVLQEIPLGNNQNAFSGNTEYIPAGNGMGARLVVNSEGPAPGWASIFSDAATETDRGQIVWAAVP